MANYHQPLYFGSRREGRTMNMTIVVTTPVSQGRNDWPAGASGHASAICDTCTTALIL